MKKTTKTKTNKQNDGRLTRNILIKALIYIYFSKLVVCRTSRQFSNFWLNSSTFWDGAGEETILPTQTPFYSPTPESKIKELNYIRLKIAEQ